MKIEVPELSLVVLVGPSGSGKSTFARTHFRSEEVVSSDLCRALASNDQNDQDATADAFEILHLIVRKRLARGLLTVIDATNVQEDARRPLLRLAREHHCLAVAVVLLLPAALCEERNRIRTDRALGSHVVRHQMRSLRRSLRGLDREGFRYVTVLRSPEEVSAVTVERRRLWTDRREDPGPFDVIGDVHGCRDELVRLLGRLGYADDGNAFVHPAGRKAVFVGDLVDRGPDSPGVLRIVMRMVERESALAVPGNHDVKLMRKLMGRNVKVTHGLAETLQQLESEPTEFKEAVRAFIDSLISHYVLDGGRLVVAHAGLRADLQGRASGKVREFALYGDTTGETDEYGLPVRHDWAHEYRGRAMVVYGHTPVIEAEWVHGTICIDTGCVFGGKLTALRYPEREFVQVEAARQYYEPARPLAVSKSPQTVDRGDGLDIDDVRGKRLVHTRYGDVLIREDSAATALEAMTRFAVDPRWLVYLPPTMSPPDTTSAEGLLEHPESAFGYYRAQGVAEVICQQKHMGSRAIAVVCRRPGVAHDRFHVAQSDTLGIVYTRTGRRFFSDPAVEEALLLRIAAAADRAGVWDRLGTDWLCLDCEVMPWSAKAQELLRTQYAPVEAAARRGLRDAVAALERCAVREPGAEPLLARFRARLDAVERYSVAYRRYCWDVRGLDGLQIAPFHVLASEGAVHSDKKHDWHMEMAATLSAADPELLVPTPYRRVELANDESVAGAIAWWIDITADGGEGMVVKPRDWLHRGAKGVVQPALKCRGREYLRIIYGPEYTLPEHLDRLRVRKVSRKRRLAAQEQVLGLESLHRFVHREPLHRVHECVFGVLALESEPIDPRL